MTKLLNENEVSSFMEKANLGEHTSRFLKRSKRESQKLDESKKNEKKKGLPKSFETRVVEVIAEQVKKRLDEQFGDDEPMGEEPPMEEPPAEEPPMEEPPMEGGDAEGVIGDVLGTVITALKAEFPEVDLDLEKDGEEIIGDEEGGDEILPPKPEGKMGGEEAPEGEEDEDEEDEELPPLQEAIAKIVEQKVKECLAKKTQK